MRRGLGISAAAVGSLFAADVVINDDFDSSVTNYFRARVSPAEKALDPRPKICILGAGWGGLSMLRKLHCDKYDVTLISPKNYFLFTPLLASTTTGRTSKSSIIEPIRSFCKRADASNVTFVESDAISVNLETNTVKCRDSSEIVGKRDEFDIDYDYLVVAVGAESATFNTPGVREHAVFMKQVSCLLFSFYNMTEFSTKCLLFYNDYFLSFRSTTHASSDRASSTRWKQRAFLGSQRVRLIASSPSASSAVAPRGLNTRASSKTSLRRTFQIHTPKSRTDAP